MLDTPVALFIFNRPLKTARVFEAIRRARPRELYIVADGLRRAKPLDLFLCEETRRAVAEIDWDCRVSRHYSDVNLGCGRRMSSGVTWVFDQVEQAILLEDDCLPAPDFFRYCAELLERYAEDPRVGLIGGTNLLNALGHPFPAGQSYAFTRYTHIWGWASWRRAWKHYDFTFSRLDEAVRSGELARIFPDPRTAAHWERAYRSVADGTVDTWDYQLQFASVLNGWANAVPARNLVSNVGFGAEATHTTGQSDLAGMDLDGLDFPLKHPETVAPDADIDDATERLIYRIRD